MMFVIREVNSVVLFIGISELTSLMKNIMFEICHVTYNVYGSTLHLVR